MSEKKKKELTTNEVVMVSGGIEGSSGLWDSIQGAILDGAIGAGYGGLAGGTNGGAAGSGGLLGVGAIAQGVGAIAGVVAGGLVGATIGATVGLSNSDDYVYGTLQSMWDGDEYPKAGLV